MAPVAPSPQGSPDLPSPTPALELVDAGNAPSSAGLGLRLPAPATALGDVFDNGAGNSDAAPALPTRRRIRFIVSRATLLANGVRRLGERNPARLSLSNGPGRICPAALLLGRSMAHRALRLLAVD
jgi:hypothetical protein